MAHGSKGSAPRQMGLLFASGPTGGMTDGQLLRRFTAEGGPPGEAEAAFSTLVARHGPLVWGICRRTAGDHHAAEDAFQATFLVLARQAGTLWVADSLGGWLRRIATRVASRCRAEARRLRQGLDTTSAPDDSDPRRLAEREDLRTAIADELARLPGKYRAPVELCHLRGLKQDEAARLLELPVGTVKSRLDRGKRRLREALTRRGLAPASAAGAVAAAAAREATAAVPASLVRATLHLATGRARDIAAIPASVAALADLASGAATLARLKLVAGVILAASACTAGGLLLAGRGPWHSAAYASPPSPARRPSPPAPSQPPPPAPSPNRPASPDSSGFLTSHEAPEAPEPDLGAAILRELNRERESRSRDGTRPRNRPVDPAMPRPLAPPPQASPQPPRAPSLPSPGAAGS
ncbi:ECF RNA polymerase sigma factor SigE [Aquisphaera giovannonii]|uniref:ECF RNA polymerase sigma factor SigE n=1 Tax=Aquisphaera giovannonii TaxID=406548 RepID=A0A5B9W727_9BACT|nr:RNA polymerase sigma factor [Aquisphaera giovannonii]QEH35895.1 ECF RNA polymerase sigma factor SigE [Aquisphaera giovannonii]